MNLVNLSISGFKLTDANASCLGSLNQMERLYLDEYDLTSLSILSGLKELKKLTLHQCEKLVDVSGLDRLLQLRILSLSGCEKLVGLSSVGALQQMQDLHLAFLHGCRELTDISCFSSLQKLKSLSLSGMQLEDISSLRVLQGLETIKFYNCSGLSDVSSLKGAKYLCIDSPGDAFDKVTGLDALTHQFHG